MQRSPNLRQQEDFSDSALFCGCLGWACVGQLNHPIDGDDQPPLSHIFSHSSQHGCIGPGLDWFNLDCRMHVGVIRRTHDGGENPALLDLSQQFLGGFAPYRVGYGVDKPKLFNGCRVVQS